MHGVEGEVEKLSMVYYEAMVLKRVSGTIVCCRRFDEGAMFGGDGRVGGEDEEVKWSVRRRSEVLSASGGDAKPGCVGAVAG